MFKLSAVRVLTMLTSCVWLVSLIVRVWQPETASTFVSVDTVMLLVIGYYFTWHSMHAAATGGGSR